VKFLQLLNLNTGATTTDNNQTTENKKRQNILNQLYNSKDKLESLMMFLSLATLDKPFYKLKGLNVDVEKKSERNDLRKINYLKKIDCFNKTIENFKKNLQVTQDQNKISQIIFRELTYMKELGFYVEDSF